MIVGIIGFILVVFLLYASMLPSGEKNSGSSSSTFFIGGPDSSGDSGGDCAAAAMAAVKTCGCVNLTSAPARIPRLYAVLAAVSRVYSSYLPSSFIQHQLQIRHYSFSCLT